MSGKGSSPRPYSGDSDKFDDNWDNIFGGETGDKAQSGDCQDTSSSTNTEERDDEG